MTKKLLQIFVFTSVVFTPINAQVTIFSEDFEAASGPENIANPYLNWQTAQFTQQTNDNYFWVLDATRCQVIDIAEAPVDLPSNYSMAVSQNNPATDGTLPKYRQTRSASTFGYYQTLIDATGYTAITLDFNWICVGETGSDYGTVVYSFDGNSWATLPTTYSGQSTIQTVTNLDFSAVDGQSFFLGFQWDNDNNGGSDPGFILDDIVVKGTPLTACNEPIQPTALALTTTDNTVNGSFTAPVPAPDHYLVVRNTTGTNPEPIDGTLYDPITNNNVGPDNIVIDNDNDTAFSSTGLAPNTTYFFYVYSFNNLACSIGPNYNTAITTIAPNENKNSITTLATTYCIPTSNNGSIYINSVSFLGTLQDIDNLNNGYGPNGFDDYTLLIPISRQAEGEGVNVYVEDNFVYPSRFKAWIDWNKDNIFDDPGELVYDSVDLTQTTTFGFVIPPNILATPGVEEDFRIRIRNGVSFSNNGNTNVFNYGPCLSFNANLNQNHRYGETEDYLFTVVPSCSAKIMTTIDGQTCGPGNVTLEVEGNGTEYRWYTTETGGNPITTPTGILNTDLTNTTTFYVTAYNGCESLERVPITGKVDLLPEVVFTPTDLPEVCGENDIISITASGTIEEVYLINENFETGGLGVFAQTSLAGNAGSIWQNRLSPYVPVAQIWKPAIASGIGGDNNFVLSNSDYSSINENILVSPVISTNSTFDDLTLSFRMYYSHFTTDGTDTANDYVAIESSLDGGAWVAITPNYTADVGLGTRFLQKSITIAGLTNITTIQIRFRFYGDYRDGVAIDDVKLFGTRPLNAAFEWTGTTIVQAYTDISCLPGTEYTEGDSIKTVYIKPTLAQSETSNFTINAEAKLFNGLCAINQDIIITNKTKIWKGTMSSDWSNPNNWSTGFIPDDTNCIIIRNGDHPSINGTTDAEGYDLLIKNGGTLTQQSNSTLFIENNIHIEASGIYNMLDSASLVQKDNVANTVDGTFTMQRIAHMRQNDYVYWSSPVTSFNIENISPGTPNGYKYLWIPTMFQGIGPPGNMDFGDWQGYNTGAMDIAKGYIIKGQTDHPNSSSPFSATFNGVPNNGTIGQSIERGDYTANPYSFQPNSGGDLLYITAEDDNWNLIGNPYPSAINAVEFLAANANIDGVVYLWTHGTDISTENPDPFYDDFEYNYNVADYLAYNASGSSIQNGFNGNIGAGQGFFVLMNDIGLSSDNVTFENTMRNSVYGNNEFYRDSDIPDQSTTNKHRIWLDFISASGETNTTLVAYVDGATNSEDRMYDAKNSKGNGLNLYSLIDDKSYIIQGRELPFTDSDVVPIGMNITESGIQTIAINSVEGLFENLTQAIFLEDVISGTIHNLSASPYMFTSEPGIINNRFILRYTNSSLTTDEYNSLNGITVFDKNDTLVVKSAYADIQSIQVFDILGRNLFANKSINVNRFIINSMVRNKSTLFLKIELTDGKQKIAKIIF
jgi:hypothetical protein